MGEPLAARVKRHLVRRFPLWAGAYHQIRHAARVRRETGRVVLSEAGFRFYGPHRRDGTTYEPGETAFIAGRLDAIDVFVDVGANAGYYTCLARQRGRHVVAIEPTEQNLELLYRNLRINAWSDVEVFPVAVAEKPGIGTLYGDGTGASLVRRWAGVSEAWQRPIPLSTLDILIAGRFAGARLLIKVDVEGAEHALLAGATETLRRQPAPLWLVEVCFAENRPEGVNPHFGEVFELFWRYGYSARSLDADRQVTRADVARWLAAGRRDFGYVSYVFERPA